MCEQYHIHDPNVSRCSFCFTYWIFRFLLRRYVLIASSGPSSSHLTCHVHQTMSPSSNLREGTLHNPPYSCASCHQIMCQEIRSFSKSDRPRHTRDPWSGRSMAQISGTVSIQILAFDGHTWAQCWTVCIFAWALHTQHQSHTNPPWSGSLTWSDLGCWFIFHHWIEWSRTWTFA